MQVDSWEAANEEEVKVRVVLPWLKRIGFDETELNLEGSFTLKLGHNSIRVGRGRSPTDQNSVRGRYDILVRRSHSNLMIIETKAPSLQLNDEDRDQAISYARLVDDICPYAVVTNGVDTKVYDSVTRELVNEGMLINVGKGSFRIAFEDESRIRQEALIHFIGLSKENMKTFAALQIQTRMQQLKAIGVDMAYRKYVPELYVSRSSTDRAFGEFTFQHSKNAFCVVGPSGAGKTNWICQTCESVVGSDSGNVPLFYSGMDLGESLLETIAGDFNVVFSTERSNVQLLRDLSNLFRRHGSELWLFIDAVDEWSHSDPVRELDEFINKVETVQLPIRLILTCRSTAWRKFELRHGVPSKLISWLYSSAINVVPDVKDRGGASQGLPCPVYQGDFNNDELARACDEYARVFAVSGLHSQNLWHILRDPFMLRLVCDVFQGDECVIPSDIAVDRLLRAYIDKKQQLVDGSDIQLRDALTRVAKIMLESSDVWVIGADLGHGVSEKAIDVLVALGVLVKTEDRFGRRLVSFYFGPLRDYIVVIDVLRLDAIDIGNFKACVSKLLETDIGQSALTWYYRFAKAEQQRYLDTLKEMRAIAFLTHYRALITRYIPSLKNRLDPFTSSEIGLVVSFHGLMVSQFAFRSLAEGDKQIEIVSGDIPLGDGIYRTHFMSSTFMTVSPIVAAANMFTSEFLKLVEDGRLDESGVLSFSNEKLYGLAYELRRELEMDVSPPIVGHEIHLDTLRDAIMRYHARCLTLMEFAQGQISAEDIPSGVDVLVRTIGPLSDPHITLGRAMGYPIPFEEMYRCIDEIKNSGLDAIGPVIPASDISLPCGKLEDFYSAERSRDVLTVFYSETISALRKLVALNFPNLEKLILHDYVTLRVTLREEAWRVVEETYFDDADRQGGDVKIQFDGSTEACDDFRVIKRGSRLFSTVIQPASHVKYPFPPASSHSPIRSEVYSILLGKLKQLEFGLDGPMSRRETGSPSLE